jgi:hypothetical protein
MFRLCWVIFRENFCYRYTKLALYSWVRMCCWLCTVYWRRELSAVPSTAHSHAIVKCNLSVTITKSCPWRWPSRVETCRSVLRLMIKLSLCICWWLVFLYVIHTLLLYTATRFRVSLLPYEHAYVFFASCWTRILILLPSAEHASVFYRFILNMCSCFTASCSKRTLILLLHDEHTSVFYFLL